MLFEIILLIALCGVNCHVSWGSWSEWTTSCPRSCSDMFGLQRRHRICLICQTEDNCFPASRPTSLSLCIGQYQQTRQCYIGSECNGQGRFTGEWSSWQEFGPCMTSLPGCDIPGQQYQLRSCVSTTDSFLSFDVQCPLGDDTHTFRLTECVKECPLEKTVRKRRTTANDNPFWSMRYVARPRDGNWGEWSHFTCVVSCGSGINIRYRYCNNPSVLDGGKPCAGSHQHIADEPCSAAPCPQHSTAVALPENIRKLIKDHLQNIWMMYDRRPGHQVRLTYLRCEGAPSRAIRSIYPYSTVLWTLNGHPLPATYHFQLFTENGDMMIWFINHHHQGVYMCQLEWTLGMRATVAIASIVIPVSAKRYVREADNVELPCNGAPLGMIFSGLKQYWFHNGEIFKDYGSTPPQLANIEYFKNVQSWFGGLWECVVSEVNTDRRWITNRVYVVVLPTTLIQRLFPDQMHFYLILAFSAIVIIALLTCCIYHNRKSDIEAEEEAKLFEKMLAERGGGKENQEENANLTDDSMSDTLADDNDGRPLIGGGTVHRDTLPQI